MDRKLIALLAAGGAVIALTLTVGLLQGPRKETLPLKDRRYLHCPKCHLEVIYDPRGEEAGCKRCGPEQALVATRESLKHTGPPPNPLVRLFVPVFVELNILIALVIWYTLAKRNKQAEEDYFLTECRGCQKRLRYHPSRVGHPGQCPRCKARFVFPPLAEEGSPARSWWKLLAWWKQARGGA